MCCFTLCPPPFNLFYCKCLVLSTLQALKMYLKIKLLMIIMNVIIFALILSANPRESLSCSGNIFTKERRLSSFLYFFLSKM